MSQQRATMAAMGTRHFHGTLAALSPGDRLEPGRGTGGVTSGCPLVFAVPADDADPSSLADAFAAALTWASWAAENDCTGSGSCIGFAGIALGHQDALGLGEIPACLHVYEVLPEGETLPDPSSDVLPRGVSMPSARVVAELSHDEIRRLGGPLLARFGEEETDEERERGTVS